MCDVYIPRTLCARKVYQVRVHPTMGDLKARVQQESRNNIYLIWNWRIKRGGKMCTSCICVQYIVSKTASLNQLKTCIAYIGDRLPRV